MSSLMIRVSKMAGLDQAGITRRFDKVWTYCQIMEYFSWIIQRNGFLEEAAIYFFAAAKASEWPG